MADPEGPSPIDPTDLLRHARSVAELLPNRSQTDYRRAVSAAYYALFHALTLRSATLLTSSDELEDQYRQARRFEHRDLRLVAIWATGAGTPPPPLLPRVSDLRGDPSVRVIANSLLLLYAERVAADYNHFARFTRSRVLDLIGVAEEAVQNLAAGSFGSAAAQTFLQLLAEQAAPRP